MEFLQGIQLVMDEGLGWGGSAHLTFLLVAHAYHNGEGEGQVGTKFTAPYILLLGMLQ